jgi:D-sedoheptulose 7-phosphate isomerase
MVAKLDSSFSSAEAVAHVRRLFEESVRVKQALVEGNHLKVLVEMANRIARSIAAGGKLMLCGNGGSAADAQHLVAELLVRLRPQVDRDAIPAITLALDTSSMTALSNDFGFEILFERMVKALGRRGDVLLGITTSGRSRNVIRALEASRAMGIETFGFLGGDGGPARQYCELAFVVPSQETGRIQESHITAGHALMELVEDQLIRDGHIHML